MATTGKIERTDVPGAVPNVTDPSNTSYIEPGALFINVTDQVLYSSNGTSYIGLWLNNSMVVVIVVNKYQEYQRNIK